MKPSMPWPTFSLLGLSFVLTIISFVSPRLFLYDHSTNAMDFEEHQQQQPMLEFVDNANESTKNANDVNYPSQLHSMEIERVGYKISNITGNFEEEQRLRYQRQDIPINESLEKNYDSNNHLNSRKSSSNLEIIELSSLVSQ